MRSKFALALMQTLAEARLSQYRLAERAAVDAPTICKWLTDEDDANHRHPTEAQVLQVFVGIGCPARVGEEMKDLLWTDPADTTPAMARLALSAPFALAVVARVTAIGQEKLSDLLEGVSTPSRSERLRVLIASRCTTAQLHLANRLLQAAGYYILTLPDVEAVPA